MRSSNESFGAVAICAIRFLGWKWLLGSDATNFVKGFQESSVDEDHLLASGT